MADVQLENGFTRIANDILEHMAMIKLSPTQYRIIFTVWRYTYGFQRKDHEMSLTFLAEAIRAHKQRVKQDLDKLIGMKIIIITEESTFSKSRKISFNKNYDDWIGLQSAKKDTVSNSADSTVSNSADQERNYLNKNIKKKDTEEDELVKRIIDVLEKSEILGEKGITSFLLEDINDIIDNFGFEQPEEMIVEAIKDSARGNGKTWKYVYKKLVAWQKENIKNLADLENWQEKSNKQKSAGQGTAKKKSLFEQGEESKKRMEAIQPSTPEEQEQMRKLEEELPY